MVLDISQQVDNYSAAKQFLLLLQNLQMIRDAQDLTQSCSVPKFRAHSFKILQDSKMKCYKLCHFSSK